MIASVGRSVRVLALTRYVRRGASSRIRFLNVITCVNQRCPGEFLFTVKPLLDDRYLDDLYGGRRTKLPRLSLLYLKRLVTLMSLANYDVVWLEKEMFPGFPAAIERLLSWLRVPVVVDYDDATFLWYQNHKSPLLRKLLGRKIDVVASRASRVIAGSPELVASIKHRAGRHADLLPSSILKFDAAHNAEPAHQKNEHFTVGWIGTPSTSTYLALYAIALEQFESTGKVTIELIGAADSALAKLRTNRYPWSELTEAHLIQRWNVAIAPLADGPWERNKCGYKIIQCMAAGLPVICSPVGVAREVIRHGENGFLASNDTDCYQTLSALKADPALAIRVGTRARATIGENYQLVGWVGKMEEIFRQLAHEKQR